MDLNRVAIFVRVVDERGFTAAARTLRLPKSSVSRAVALLEQELGARLLRRSTRNVTLTEAGSTFYAQASPGVSAIQEARAAVVDLDKSIRGTIRMTAANDAGVWLLAPLVAAFAELHPEVLIETTLTGRVVDLVEEGFDLALRFGDVRDHSLVARKVATMSPALYAAPRYLEKHGTPKHVADLAKHQCVLFRATRGRARWTLTSPDGEETVEVTGPVASDDFAFVHRAAIAGAGIALVPTFVAEAKLPGIKLTRVLPRWIAPGAQAHLVYPSGRYLPHRVAVFRDFLLAELAR